MNNGNQFNAQEVDLENRVNLARLYHSLVSKWYLIVLSILLCGALAYLYAKTTTAQYEVKSTLVINKEDKAFDMSELFSSTAASGYTEIAEHLGILRSFNINYQTLRNLDWRTSAFEKDPFKEYDLYKNSPFIIESNADSLNLREIPVFLVPIDDKTVNVVVDAVADINGTEQSIKIDKKITYGEEFASNYFRFTVQKSEHFDRFIASGREFYFKFNDIYALTNEYISKLRILFESEESNVITLSLTVEQIKRGVDYLNQLSIVYIQYGLNEKNQMSSNTITFIDQQLSGVVDSLEVAGQNFTDFRSRNRIVDLSQEATMVVDKLEQIESEESSAKIRLEYYQNLSSYLGDAEQMEQVIAPSVVGITDPSLNSMVVNLSELYSRKNALSIVVEKKNPSLIAIENEIEYLRRSLGENLNNLISNAQVQLNAIESRKGEINSQLARMPKTEQDLVNIKRQFDLNNELYTFLLQKRAEAAINKASNIPDVKILDPAMVDLALKVGPKRILIYLTGLVVGFLLPSLLIFLFNYFDNTFDGKDEVERNTNVRIISDILQSDADNKLPTLNAPKSGVSETFRNLRTNLKFLTNQNHKIISVISTGSGEGKTFISLNLAITLTMNNKKVLLIGADLRKPKLQDYLRVSPDHGLSNYLVGEKNIKDVIVKTKVKNLEVILSGPLPPNPAELLESAKFEVLLEECKKYYDYILIDNAPVPVVTDGMVVGNQSDINLFVLRLNYTPRQNIKFINQIARNGDLKNVFMVLNGVKAKRFGYYRIYGQNGYYKTQKRSKEKTKI